MSLKKIIPSEKSLSTELETGCASLKKKKRRTPFVLSATTSTRRHSCMNTENYVRHMSMSQETSSSSSLTTTQCSVYVIIHIFCISNKCCTKIRSRRKSKIRVPLREKDFVINLLLICTTTKILTKFYCHCFFVCLLGFSASIKQLPFTKTLYYASCVCITWQSAAEST